MTTVSAGSIAAKQSARRPRLSRVLALASVVAAICAAPLPAHAGLIFTTTFDGTVSGAAQAAILSGLSEYSTLFSDNVNVSLSFTNTGSGLAQTSSYSLGIGYQQYYNALVADSTSAADATALARLALDGAGANNPVNGTGFIAQGRAGLRSVGLDFDALFFAVPGYVDGAIAMNLALMNFDRITIDPNKYDLKSVLQHEVDEVLGSISNVGESDPRPVDLFRYDASGNRSFTTNPNAASYFSIDGTTLLARYNQLSGPDYGDFYSCGVSTPAPQVQDACGTPGATANLGVELTLLDVIGWNRITSQTVPEPGSLVLVLTAGLLGFGASRRKG